MVRKVLRLALTDCVKKNSLVQTGGIEDDITLEETASTLQPAEERKSMTNCYTDRRSHFVAESPSVSLPQIMEFLPREGPLGG